MCYCFRKIIRDDKSVDKPQACYSNESNNDDSTPKPAYFDNSNTNRKLSQEEINEKHEAQIIKHKELMERRKKY